MQLIQRPVLVRLLNGFKCGFYGRYFNYFLLSIQMHIKYPLCQFLGIYSEKLTIWTIKTPEAGGQLETMHHFLRQRFPFLAFSQNVHHIALESSSIKYCLFRSLEVWLRSFEYREIIIMNYAYDDIIPVTDK